MADEDEDVISEEELTDGLEKKKLSGKKIIIIVGAGLVALLAIIGIASFFFGGDDADDSRPAVDAHLDQLSEDEAARQAEATREPDLPPEELKLLFHEIPTQTFNLNTGGEGNSFLKATIILELDRESYKEDVDAKMPRVLDELHTYMRELRPEDLDGAQGLFRLKEELLMRINQAVAPSRVKDVLFQEFLIQGS